MWNDDVNCESIYAKTNEQRHSQAIVMNQAFFIQWAAENEKKVQTLLYANIVVKIRNWTNIIVIDSVVHSL